MNNLQNLHTHSTYSDGADTLEEMVLTAIEKGFSSLGFSGHSYMHYAPEYSMSIEGTKKYKNEVFKLKEKYKNEISIYCGLEFDMFSEVDLSGYDYLIGSVHYFKINNEYVGFDRSQDVVKGIIDKYFGGKGIEYAKAYYKLLSHLPEYGNFDIIGHFDIITKHADNVFFFDEDSKEYRNAAIEAAEALAGKIPLFEMNTGAIARGYRKNPYPAEFLLRELKRLGFGVCITSDCHNRNMLDCSFNESTRLLKDCGFEEKYILTDKGFIPVPL